MPLQVGLYVESQEGVTWDDWRRVAVRAQALGFDALECSVHLLPLEAPGRWTLDIWVVFAAIALWTTRLRFGPLVLPVTFYHPASIARLAASLDRLSGGRFELGLGAGRDAREHTAFGLPFPGHDERMAMFAEAVEVIRLLWSGETVSYAGRWYRLEQAQIRPTPTRPWIGVGGNSDPSLALAAAHADDWSTTSAPIEQLVGRNARLDDLAREAGREPRAIQRTLMNGVVVGRDAAELEQRARRMAVLVPGLADLGPQDLLGRLAEEWGWWIGTPQEVARQAAAAVRAGFGRVFLQVYDAADLEAVDLLAAEVVPRLRAGTG